MSETRGRIEARKFFDSKEIDFPSERKPYLRHDEEYTYSEMIDFWEGFREETDMIFRNKYTNTKPMTEKRDNKPGEWWGRDRPETD